MFVCARRRCTTRTDEKVAAGDDGGGGLVGELLRDSAGPWFGGKHVLPRDGEAGLLGGDCTSFANGQGGHVAIISAL